MAENNVVTNEIYTSCRVCTSKQKTLKFYSQCQILIPHPTNLLAVLYSLNLTK